MHRRSITLLLLPAALLLALGSGCGKKDKEDDGKKQTAKEWVLYVPVGGPEGVPMEKARDKRYKIEDDIEFNKIGILGKAGMPDPDKYGETEFYIEFRALYPAQVETAIKGVMTSAGILEYRLEPGGSGGAAPRPEPPKPEEDEEAAEG